MLDEIKEQLNILIVMATKHKLAIIGGIVDMKQEVTDVTIFRNFKGEPSEVAESFRSLATYIEGTIESGTIRSEILPPVQ